MTALSALVGQTLRLAVRAGGGAMVALVFFLAVVTVIPFGVGPDLKLLARIGPAILWIAALLASLLGLERLFGADREDGSLDVYLRLRRAALRLRARARRRTLDRDRPAARCRCADPGIAPEPRAARHGGGGLTLLVGTPALTLIGAVGAALTAGLPRGGLLVTVLVLPFTIPVLIFGVLATQGAISDPEPFLAPFLLLLRRHACRAGLAPIACAAALNCAGVNSGLTRHIAADAARRLVTRHAEPDQLSPTRRASSPFRRASCRGFGVWRRSFSRSASTSRSSPRRPTTSKATASASCTSMCPRRCSPWAAMPSWRSPRSGPSSGVIRSPMSRQEARRRSAPPSPSSASSPARSGASRCGATWWVWDARLTSFLVLFIMYLGLIALWRAFEDPARAGRVVAILILVGSVNIPIIKFSVEWWNTLHQGESIFRIGRPEHRSVDALAALHHARGFRASSSSRCSSPRCAPRFSGAASAPHSLWLRGR